MTTILENSTDTTSASRAAGRNLRRGDRPSGVGPALDHAGQPRRAWSVWPVVRSAGLTSVHSLAAAKQGRGSGVAYTPRADAAVLRTAFRRYRRSTM